MTQQQEWLGKRVKAYLKKLTKPRPEFGGCAPCPALAEHIDNIAILHAKGRADTYINHVANIFRPLGLSAAVIIYERQPKNLFAITDRVLNTANEIEIFISEPQLTGRVRGVYTGFPHATLVIIQDLALLQKAREHAKKAGYYGDNNTTE